MSIKHLDHLNMTVTNLDESLDWYAKVFGFELVEDGLRDETRWAIIRSGEAMLCLYEHPERAEPRRFLRDDRHEHVIYHYGFRISDRHRWLNRVDELGLELHYGGEVRYGHSTSWYIEDPTGYSIEVVLWDDDNIAFDRPLARAS